MITYLYAPVGMDSFDPTANAPAAGTLVRKVQPYGCPANGTMGFCYVVPATATRDDRGNWSTFPALVRVASLT